MPIDDYLAHPRAIPHFREMARRVLAEAGVRAAPVTAILRALYGTGSNTSANVRPPTDARIVRFERWGGRACGSSR